MFSRTWYMIKLLHIGHAAFFIKLCCNFFTKPWNIFKIYIEFKEFFIVNKWVFKHEVVMFRSGLIWFHFKNELVLQYERSDTNFAENDLLSWLLCKSFVNSFVWLHEDVWMISRCWKWYLFYYNVFSPLFGLWEIIWCCWIIW